MTDQFVTNEQAIALKELGFNEITLTYFDSNHVLQKDIVCVDGSKFWNLSDYQEIAAPLKQQVIKWMLEKHHVYGWVEHYWYPLGHRWKACVKNLDGKKVQINGELHSYNEALCKCIDMLIEYVKN